jgi:NDP-sugar pyrophosphorylase family protein
MSRLPTVCVLAGGLGSRLGDRVAQTPKPLVEVAGEPFLMHQFRLLADHGFEKVVLCVGYLGDRIEATIGDECFGIAVEYSYDSHELDGTLGAIRRARSKLGDEFLVLYGDTYLRLDYARAVEAWRASGEPGFMTVLRNDDRWGVSNTVYRRRRVLIHDKTRRTSDMHWIDYGLGGLRAEALSAVAGTEDDLSALYGRLAVEGRLFGYLATNRFFEIGTEEGLQQTERFLLRARAMPR